MTPNEMTILNASSTDISSSIASFSGISIKNPDVGFGVVGTKIVQPDVLLGIHIPGLGIVFTVSLIFWSTSKWCPQAWHSYS